MGNTEETGPKSEEIDIFEMLLGLPEDSEYQVRIYRIEDKNKVYLGTADVPFDAGEDIKELYGGGEYMVQLTRRGKVIRSGRTKIAGAPKEIEEDEDEGEKIIEEDRITALEDEIDTLRNTIEFNQRQLLERLGPQAQQTQGTQQNPMEMATTLFTKAMEMAKAMMPQQPQRSEMDLLIKGMELGSGFGGADVEVEKVRAYKEIATSPEVWENIKETVAIMSEGEKREEGGGGGKTTKAKETIQLLRFLAMAKKGIERNTGPEIYVYMLEDQTTPEQLDRIKAMGIDGFYKMLEQHKERLKHLYPIFTSSQGKDWINDFFGLLKATPEEREAILSGELGEGEEKAEKLGFKPKPKPEKKEKGESRGKKDKKK